MIRYSLASVENPYIAWIRDGEIAKPAPFGSLPLLVLPSVSGDNRYAHMWESEGEHEVAVADVPVLKIAGVGQTGHLHNFAEGMTFRQVLFNCLHGESLCEASLEYFLSDGIKAHSLRERPDFAAFPQDPTARGPKVQGFGGISFEQRGDWFFVNQGQQRTLMAMFWIYQHFGDMGLLKQVDVYRLKARRQA